MKYPSLAAGVTSERIKLIQGHLSVGRCAVKLTKDNHEQNGQPQQLGVEEFGLWVEPLKRAQLPSCPSKIPGNTWWNRPGFATMASAASFPICGGSANQRLVMSSGWCLAWWGCQTHRERPTIRPLHPPLPHTNSEHLFDVPLNEHDDGIYGGIFEKSALFCDAPFLPLACCSRHCPLNEIQLAPVTAFLGRENMNGHAARMC
ncbi:hypothetical protein VTI74DRAFT_11133 [Chaetomium olivicolor]